MKTEDLEDATAPNSPDPQNRAFYSQVYRVPAADTVSRNSDLVFTIGAVSSTGDFVSAVAVGGVTVTATRPGTGDYRVPQAGEDSSAASQRVVGMARVNGASG